MFQVSTSLAASLLACMSPSSTNQVGGSNACINYITSFYSKPSPAASIGWGRLVSPTWGRARELFGVDSPADFFLQVLYFCFLERFGSPLFLRLDCYHIPGIRR